MQNEFTRTEKLIGKEGLQKLSVSSVAVFGIGGVGGFVVEALVRAGLGNLTLIDGDRVDITNINRQIHATHATIGRLKAEAMRERALMINPRANIEALCEFYRPGVNDHLISNRYDYIVDAVDAVSAKIGIIAAAHKADIPVISSMGAGNKLDPSRFVVSDIFHTSVCPLARVMRRELKRIGIPALKVVYSDERPIILAQGSRGDDPDMRPETPASISFVPSVAGMMIAAEVTRHILGIELSTG